MHNIRIGSLDSSATLSDDARVARPKWANVPMELYRVGQEFVVECELPRSSKSKLELNVDGRLVSVSAAAERRTRRRATPLFRLADDVDVSRVRASFGEGRLRVELPSAKPPGPPVGG
jgi:HSP20 family protein